MEDIEIRDWATTDNVPKSRATAPIDRVVQRAMANPGKMVTYSTPHTQASARQKAKRIRGGNPVEFEPYLPNLRVGTHREVDGTYSVVIGWKEAGEA